MKGNGDVASGTRVRERAGGTNMNAKRYARALLIGAALTGTSVGCVGVGGVAAAGTTGTTAHATKVGTLDVRLRACSVSRTGRAFGWVDLSTGPPPIRRVIQYASAKDKAIEARINARPGGYLVQTKTRYTFLSVYAGERIGVNLLRGC
jgi:hypothetical protein